MHGECTYLMGIGFPELFNKDMDILSQSLSLCGFTESVCKISHTMLTLMLILKGLSPHHPWT